MSKIIAYLMFNGNAREAMEFYKECLGGELSVQTVGESPMATSMTSDSLSKVMHSALMNGNLELFASDMMGETTERTVGNAIEIALVCDTKEEIESSFEKLAEGGEITQPLINEYFGMFGKVVDKFGINWMFQFHNGKNLK